jgi:hypothetical protein
MPQQPSGHRNPGRHPSVPTLALGALHGQANVLSPASPEQVRHPLLEAAVGY